MSPHHFRQVKANLEMSEWYFRKNELFLALRYLRFELFQQPRSQTLSFKKRQEIQTSFGYTNTIYT